jgi:predicted metallo-beta-lactamase superfamily hydrolase
MQINLFAENFGIFYIEDENLYKYGLLKPKHIQFNTNKSDYLRAYEIDEALKSIRVPISSINHI